MPLRLQRPVSPNLNEKVLRSYTEEAARLRDLAAHVTTAASRHASWKKPETRNGSRKRQSGALSNHIPAL